MKKILITCSFFLSTFGFCQQKLSSLALSGGITEKKGLGFMVNYTYNSNNSNYEFAILHSLFKDENIENNTINYSTTTLNIGYLHTVLRNTNNSITINLGAGVSGGFENVSKPNNQIILTSKNGFIAGAYAVVQSDFYLSDTFSLLFRAQENFMIISTTGKLNPYISAGIKFNL